MIHEPSLGPSVPPSSGPRALSLRDVLLRNVALYGAEPAVRFEDHVTTWSGLARHAFRLANRLAADGVRRGDRVAVLQRNGPEIEDIYFAAAVLGAVVVPLSERMTMSEVAYVLGDSTPVFAFVEAGHPATTAFDGLPTVATRDAAFASFRDEGSIDEPPELEFSEDAVLQLYTSGTTGRPKGVVVTQGAMVQNGLSVQLAQRQRHTDVFLSATPLTHAAAGTRVFSLAIDGLTHAILERFDPAAFVDAVERYGATTTLVVPTMIQDLLDAQDIDLGRLASLRSLVYGAAPAPLALVLRAIEALPCGLLQGYGLTEGCPALTLLSAEEHRRFAGDASLQHRLTSIGRPVPGVRFALRGPDGGLVAPGEVGELVVRSTKTMVGYWHLPDATAETFRDGWLLTGDIGRQDDAGYVYLLDRKKDMLISGGLNVYPSEIERVLLEDPDVEEAAVIGAADERWGEVPVAFVVAAPSLDVDRLVARCREQLARYKQPREVVVVDELPRNATGKVLKAALRERAQQLPVGDP